MNKKFDFFDLILIAITIFTIGLVLGKLNTQINGITFDLSSIVSSIIAFLTLLITYSALKVASEGLDTWRKQKVRELTPKIYSGILNIDSYFNTLDFSGMKKALNGDIGFFVNINKFLGREIVLLQTNLLDYKNYIKNSKNLEQMENSLIKMRTSYAKYKDIVMKNSSVITQKQIESLSKNQTDKSKYINETDELNQSVKILLNELGPEIKVMVKNAKELFHI